ncbi:MAG TPA: peptide deformylase [Anaerolineae bacterium]|nr:peptide deformylase [Anaerolineae bacterium]
MAIRKILTVPDPRLRQKARPVKRVDKRVQALFDDMLETMHAAPGIGLAATQIGVGLRVIVLELPEEEEGNPLTGEPIFLANPELVSARGSEEEQEGCLSVPGFVGYVERATDVTVQGLDRRGRKVRIEASGLLARALQHEIDHLDGVLYVDRLSGPDKLFRIVEEEEETSSETAHKERAGM